MTTLFNKLKQVFSKAGGKTAVSPDPESAERMARFLQVIEADEYEQIESARDWVQPDDIDKLVAHYWTLDNWQQKRVVVEILQDRHSAEMPKMMLDFLRAPDVRDDSTELAKAIALGFIDERYDQFMKYYNDRVLLHRTIKEVLRKNGLKLASSPEQSTPAPKPAKQMVDLSKPPNQRLMDGAWGGDLTAVKQALADGASIDVGIGSGSYKGCSPLLMAFIYKQFDIADYLIDQGADVNYKRPAQHTPDRTKGQTPLWWAANHDQMKLAQKLIQKGADVNTPDHHGSTPLSQAASSGHLDMVTYLVGVGADVHSEIYDGRKPFNLAITNGYKRVAEYLLTQGNNPNEGGSSGYTPLMISAENGFLDLAKLLVRQGADVNAVHSGATIYIAMKGWTPLVFAVRAGYVRMTKFLIQSGANVNYIVPAGQTYDGKPIPARRVIEFATGKRAESILKLLKDAGAA